MKNDILDKEYVLNNGINLKALWGEYCSDRILDKPEEEGGKPFTGLAYELYNNGQLIYYCFYKDGFECGEYVEFHENGNIESKQYMKYGQIRGKEELWFEDGKLKSISEYEFGICLTLKEWDYDGKLVKEKLSPIEEDIKNLKRERESNKRLGRD
ncbi:hypothetical protein LL037_14755 [Clostridium estertheticum]|uniref:Toxin-antitoxin system YwqK family antitoxin n=1 Tax=Clostridium estertheticum TaxID=238834 RepID=A0AA47EKY4_9CLOT|nr:hypothetical protein [Clostridium estertheticum]MBU3157933.1 hypothetical protein [Clostridium estertheticum]MBU3202424.1 hypothetical protein [Clostridium estertheticum]WAG62143.1 hypothetical protein LL038_07880 [Clostridium estertheticum]WAG63740.1 hypothetical protein LL037_14755 [Clostridium estertheticum]